MSNIVIAAGGSGGHIFPAIKVAKTLAKNGHDIIFIGNDNLFVEKIKKEGFTFREVKSRGFKPDNVKALILFIVSLLSSFFTSFKVIWKINPDAVIGFGGYSSFSTVMCSVLLLKPTVIHEQNVVPGRANKMLSLFVRKIAISFKESEKFFNKRKTVFTGCPLNIEKTEYEKTDILNKFNFSVDKKTILIFGGSQGSHKINGVAVEAISLLIKDIPAQVIHISGPKDRNVLYDDYKKSGVPFLLFDFYDNIEELYSIADIVVSRAGAVTITEIAMFDKPAVLIPYPYAGGHQIHNAMLLQNCGKAFIVKDDELSPGLLKEKILYALSSNSKYQNIYVEDSSERIKNIMESLL